MNKIYPTLLAFLLLLAIGTAKAQHFAPDLSAFDNYMTITGYVVIDGKEIGSANYEIGCFINGQCRGSYQVAAVDYLGHKYTCFLSVWGSSSDNGKAISIKVYDQSAGKEYECSEKPVYQYNGELGTDVPYQLTVFTDPSQMQYNVATGSPKNGSVAADKTSVKSGTQVTLTITPNAGYELATITAAKTNESGTNVALSGTGTTRTFIMPAYGVTVTATFQKTADQQAIEAAIALIEAANFAPIQTDAPDETTAKTWLTTRINALPGMAATGITVMENNITMSDFLGAIAGTASDIDGINGSFRFTVRLVKGASSVSTVLINSTINATDYVPPVTYSVSITQTTNGLVTPDVTSSISGETVSLTIIPSDGFELNTIKAYKTGSTATVITLSGTGNTRIFTMPAYPVTVSATFKKTQATLDAEAVTTAKELIENVQFSFNQFDGNTEAAIKQQLADKINALPGMAATGITVMENNITMSDFLGAIAGTASDIDGINGSFRFTVRLVKGASSVSTVLINSTINATDYVPPVTYSVSITQTTNGLVTPDVTSSISGETVTLTIIPSDGFELNTIKAYRTGATATVITLSGTGNTRIFTMPAYPVTVSATFKKTQATLDAEAVTTAKELIENGQFSFNQFDGNTEAAIKQQLADKINALPGMSGIGITVSANDITINEFSAAVAGSSGNPNGTNGTFSFNVDLEKGAIVATTSPKTGSVLATVYISVTTVTINMTTAKIMEGESEMLIATVSPGNATNPDIVWTSSDESVATVDGSGLVTGVLRGTATITATTINGLTASCLVTVDRVTGIDNLKAAQLKIYPNPANSELRVESGELRIKGVTISDLMGRKIVHCKWSNNQQVDVSQLAPGVYVVNIETENSERIQRKIVKN